MWRPAVSLLLQLSLLFVSDEQTNKYKQTNTFLPRDARYASTVHAVVVCLLSDVVTHGKENCPMECPYPII